MLHHTRWYVFVSFMLAGCGTQIAPGDGGSDAPTDVAPTDTGVDSPQPPIDAARDAAVDSPVSDVPVADVPLPDVPNADVPPGDSAVMHSGDCRNDTDCFGQPCVEVLPGGFRTCKEPQQVSMGCQNPDFDQCDCNGMLCPAGDVCLRSPEVPYCGGAAMLDYNRCVHDLCQSDADCQSQGPNTFCIVGGTLQRQVRACVYAACRVDADCNAQPGGICAPVLDPCCGAPAGLFCVYPGGCRSNNDCNSAAPNCVPDFQTGIGRCQSQGVPCPG